MANHATHEIWARVVWAAMDLAKRGGLSASDVLHGLPFDEAELRRRKRVAWADYISIVERAAELLGGVKQLEDLTAAQYSAGAPEVARVARALVSPKLLFRFVVEVLDPVLFPSLQFSYEDLGGDRARIAIHLQPGARPSPVFFAANSGAFRGLTNHLGLPEARILACDTSGTHGIWELGLPKARTVAHRAGRYVLRIVLGAEADGTAVAATLGSADPDSLELRLDEATLAWGLTPRQREVLALVAKGQSNKEVAHGLACAENTVELHVTQLFRRSGLTSRAQLIATFWTTSWGFPQ